VPHESQIEPDDYDEDDFEEERITLIEDPNRLSFPGGPHSTPTPRNRALLTVLTGPERGAVFKLPAGECTIGRSNESTVTIVDQGLSRIHARIKNVGGAFMLTDGGSTNGTFVNEVRIGAPTRIEAGMRFRLGHRTVVAVSLHDELEESAALSVHEAALRDRLTGVYNRGVFDDRLTSEIAFSKRHKTPLSVVLFDIDHFKSFNDTHGHLTGDAVLVAVGKQVQETVRTEDIVARYGGEEFVVIARDTPSDRALILGERIRAAVERCEVEANDTTLRVTISVGIATLSEENLDVDSQGLVGAADRALYVAKESGRNCVRHAADLPD
jgi:two-component system cell cycle response regulator